MAVTFAVGVRACCVAVGLLLAAARAGEPVSPLVGATREQLLSRYGEPRSQIESGNLVVLFYPRERVVLRNNVVVEVEQLSADAPPPPDAPPTAAAETAGDAENPAAPVTTPSPSLPGPDSKLEIKLVRPPSAKGSAPAIPEPPKPALVPKAPAPVPVVPTIVPAEISTAETETVPAGGARQEKNEVENTPSTATVASGKAPAAEKPVDNHTGRADSERAAPAPVVSPTQTPAPEPDVGVISNRTYLIAAIVIVSGLIFLFWRRRQLQAELAASSVENTPVPTAISKPFTGNRFTADVLNSLEWMSFEELVVAYYSKTGVVAVRTKTGPDSPVHIKISWKGEPRPFAYVQSISNPAGLIDVKPLQALVASLEADDIRRGYVVTTGKFNVTARDFAEEKHLTLLPGDVFLEKLNALPATARAEIMQSMGGGDHLTPL